MQTLTERPVGPNFQDKGPVQLRVGHEHLCGLTYLETNPTRVKGQRIFFPSLLQKQRLQEWGVGGDLELCVHCPITRTLGINAVASAQFQISPSLVPSWETEGRWFR